ncbi:Cysteine protease StiP OS=Lysinibacillus sphaericus OX=1421 GN=stiP PE=4 SV=1 [Lysinibacillus sphaericus]
MNSENDLFNRGHIIQKCLPVEYLPSEAYMTLFYQTLEDYAERIALAVGVVAQQIVARQGLEHLVLVSLARAGTPIGILIKRFQFLYRPYQCPFYTSTEGCSATTL